ncbi:ATP-binding protein [Blastococcus sp. MG754426]|uniref:ATP-binding protein n=1 Tax=unclassified Blastococcus TaxID=2619396 RepID=UPI001EF09849|nr:MULTISPECIES: ATP-binding protein [unclassified Blastococcus]MCF6509681.1 ATP-binding protein [Blastococcus sp. MG754426]MCF6514071.1 ATP-binding protein [Blastococcus sp. MG754427]MCF6737127.1 ATP-binding protein [Blastococcus sp. KM273129]
MTDLPAPRSPVAGRVGRRATPASPMSSVAWGQSALPHAHDCWQRVLGTLRDVGRARSEVRRRLADAAAFGDPADHEEAAERMVLGLDELTSNGLRHGRQPVGLRVCTLPGHWLVDVTDAASDMPPSPSPGRPAGQGGYGLFMIAAYATAYGWVPEEHCKHVWALFPRG